MIRVKTLTIQLIDAQPDRIRICRVEGESLVTIVIPREDLAEAKALVEAVPAKLKEAVSKEEGEEIKSKLEAVGAKVELK